MTFGGHSARIKSLLVLHGIRAKKVDSDFIRTLDKLKDGLDKPLHADLKAEICREYIRYQVVAEQIKGRRHRGDETDPHADAIEGSRFAVELDFGDGVFRLEKFQEPAPTGGPAQVFRQRRTTAAQVGENRELVRQVRDVSEA